MNFISWNCRGVLAKGFTGLVKDIRREYEASLIFLLETHASGDKARNQAKKTGLTGNFIIDSQGHSGGIWCLWDESLWRVDIIDSSDQFVHLQVTWKGRISWFISVVYASPRLAPRQILWDDLRAIADNMEEPWVILGDFNSIMVSHERRGGAPNFATRGMQNFCNMIHDCNLLDAGFQGSPFTWRHGRLYQRLDRVLINLQWRLKFQSASVFHLPFFKSDHRALLTQLQKKKKPNRHRRPFQFLASWLMHEDFPNLMSREWSINGHWCNQVELLQESILSWNKIVFGNIFDRKKRLIRELEVLDDKLVANPTQDLEDQHKRIWTAYNQVLSQEELLWF